MIEMAAKETTNDVFLTDPRDPSVKIRMVKLSDGTYAVPVTTQNEVTVIIPDFAFTDGSKFQHLGTVNLGDGSDTLLFEINGKGFFQLIFLTFNNATTRVRIEVDGENILKGPEVGFENYINIANFKSNTQLDMTSLDQTPRALYAPKNNQFVMEFMAAPLKIDSNLKIYAYSTGINKTMQGALLTYRVV